MVSTATAAIIAAICAAGGALLGTMSTGIWTIRVERLKRQRKEMDISQKHRDPLLRAAERLQTRIRQLCQTPLSKVDINHLNFNHPHSYDYCFTLFLFGQFFAWSLVLENDVPAMHYRLNVEDIKVLNILYRIHRVMDDPGTDETFRIYTGVQAAIAEVMTIKKGNCMGYADFVQRWILDPPTFSLGDKTKSVKFRAWFSQIESGLEALEEITEPFPPCKTVKDTSPDLVLLQPVHSENFPFPKLHRLIQLQHLLISLILVLDPGQQRGPQHVRDIIQPWDRTANTNPFKCSCPRCLPKPSPNFTFPATSLAAWSTFGTSRPIHPPAYAPIPMSSMQSAGTQLAAPRRQVVVSLDRPPSPYPYRQAKALQLAPSRTRPLPCPPPLQNTKLTPSSPLTYRQPRGFRPPTQETLDTYPPFPPGLEIRNSLSNPTGEPQAYALNLDLSPPASPHSSPPAALPISPQMSTYTIASANIQTSGGEDHLPVNHSELHDVVQSDSDGLDIGFGQAF